jgi:hypothetical protein
MTISSNFVYVPENETPEQTQPSHQASQKPAFSEQELHRQAQVKKAQQQGGLMV